MGWTPYHSFHGIPVLGKHKKINVLENKDLIKFHIYDQEKKVCFIINEQTIKEKQISNKLYNFIIIELFDDNKSTSTKMIQFSSNEELLKLIMEHEACDEEYQRHFRINKILKK